MLGIRSAASIALAGSLVTFAPLFQQMSNIRWDILNSILLIPFAFILVPMPYLALAGLVLAAIAQVVPRAVYAPTTTLAFITELVFTLAQLPLLAVFYYASEDHEPVAQPSSSLPWWCAWGSVTVVGIVTCLLIVSFVRQTYAWITLGIYPQFASHWLPNSVGQGRLLACVLMIALSLTPKPSLKTELLREA